MWYRNTSSKMKAANSSVTPPPLSIAMATNNSEICKNQLSRMKQRIQSGLSSKTTAWIEIKTELEKLHSIKFHGLKVQAMGQQHTPPPKIRSSLKYGYE
jgi:hypothetical protein